MKTPYHVLYSLSNVRKTYRTSEQGRPALDVDRLDIPCHRVVAILGYSGSGKTTLLNLLGLLDAPDPAPVGAVDRPVIRFYDPRDGGSTSEPGGIDLVADPRRLAKIRKQLFGYVFQEGYLLKNLSSQFNILIPLFINGLKPSESPVDDYLRNVDLPPEIYASRLPTELSGGQAQRVALIRAIVHNPTVLLVDEPSGRLDQEHGWQIMRSLVHWCHGADHRTLLWVTHNLAQAAELADHVIILRDGKVVMSQANDHHSEMVLLRWLRHPLAPLAPSAASEAERAIAALPQEAVAPRPATAGKDYTVWKEIRTVRHALPGWGLACFIVHFALADLFPQMQRPAAAGGTARLSQALRRLRAFVGVRKTQGLNILALFLVLLLALFFANVSLWLKNYFVWSISDPRMNHMTVNGKRHGDLVLTHQDMQKLSTLAWVDDPDRGWVISWDEHIRAQGLRPQRPAILGAYGSRDRPMDFYLHDEAPMWGPGTFALDIVIMHAADPILAQVDLLTGSTVAALSPSGDSVKARLAALAARASSAVPGVVITRKSLEKDLKYTGAIPTTVAIELDAQKRAFPLLGIVDWLPFGADGLVMEGWYNRHFFQKNTADTLPGYDRIAIYIRDMLRDGLPLVDALIDMQYQTTYDIKSRLTWVKNLSDFIFWSAFIAIVGIAVLVAGTLVVSYTQAVRQKRHEIGVLLAHGIPKPVLHLIFLFEVVIVWALAVVCALPLHQAGAWFLQRVMVEKFRLQMEVAQIFSIPPYVYPTILGISLALAILAVIWAVYRTLHGRIADILKTAE